MALPKIDLPLYELELPSNGKKIKFRPFTVKEEKILLIAQESKDPAQVINSVKQIANNCLIDCTIDDLALFDLEYLIIRIRSKSIDNMVNFEIRDPDTDEKVQLKLDLDMVKVEKTKDHINKIKLSDVYTLFLKYPNIDDLFFLTNETDTSSEKNFKIMISCMDKLVSEDEVYKFADFSQKEIDNFVESLHSDNIKKLKQFFDTMPKIRHEIPYENSEGKNTTFVIQGTQTFFI